MFGSDDASETFFMLYFDERVSRKYDLTLRDVTWKWWRTVPGFSQRFTGRIFDDGRTIIGQGELCRDGHTREGDLQLTYTRVE